MDTLGRFAKHSFVVFDIVVKKKTNGMWLSVVCTFVDNDTRHYRGQNVVQQIELHHKVGALLSLLSTSAAYTHGQIVDAELANQSARFALVML